MEQRVNQKEKTTDYLRVGTDYYKIVHQPLASGDKVMQIKPWTRTAIKEDYGDPFVRKIEKYNGFCNIPSHLNYKKTHQGFYNKYMPVNWQPQDGKFETVKLFMEHIFGEQIELGYDYIKLLIEKPNQRLPIFCLVSQERNTGKTTFLNWLKQIFDQNMTINTNEDFESRFNSDWTNKLIIAIDEAFFDKKETSERIKNLSTSRTFKSEAKNKDKMEVEFFGKFILCSNNEENFIKIDDDEIRYWIRKIKPLVKDDVRFPEKLKSEIPAFIFWLTKRSYSTTEKTRMWFTKDQIQTEALEKVVRKNIPLLEQELKHIIHSQLDDFSKDEISFTTSDLVQLLRSNSSLRVSQTQLRDILQSRWKQMQYNNSYDCYTLINQGEGQEYYVQSSRKKGRHYTFFRSMFEDPEKDEETTPSINTVDNVDTNNINIKELINS